MRAWILCVSLLACKGGDEGKSHPYEGLLDLGLANPYPSHLLVQDGHLVLPDSLLPDDVAHPDFSRITWREGFSPAQTSVLRLPNISSAELPTFLDIQVGEGSVLLVDLDAGELLPVMAELDAWPDAEEPVLLIRPLHALPVGHQVSVVVLKSAVERPPSFDALLADDAPGNSDLVGHVRALVDQLGTLNIPENDIAVAWDFPVSRSVMPLTSALSQAEFDGDIEVVRVRDLEADDSLPPHVWRSAEGTYQVTNFLVDDLNLDLQADGTVLSTGTAEAELFVIVPSSVADAPAGTVPVLVFGHGIFSSPALYLDLNDDPSDVLALADNLGAIVVATTWRGLTLGDSVEVL
ncbi:MAG: hypothetical protein GWP91_17790, partial [Rhodobacterales bacterium]|nr:hypothetical protein [Rhodobacterales bacterium]